MSHILAYTEFICHTPSWSTITYQEDQLCPLPTIIPGDPGCQLYLGVNRTRA
ncbi:unnamed protein product [Brassica napus]|uniref:(rape) hypothetical protein n=1 Tax=Brassica napus TaxID=3708 RepID=A0A816P0L8_BRANA|nr:unnamed protein product [Brassica napus]